MLTHITHVKRIIIKCYNKTSITVQYNAAKSAKINHMNAESHANKNWCWLKHKDNTRKFWFLDMIFPPQKIP